MSVRRLFLASRVIVDNSVKLPHDGWLQPRIMNRLISRRGYKDTSVSTTFTLAIVTLPARFTPVFIAFTVGRVIVASFFITECGRGKEYAFYLK
jgi:hypothetical protein